MKPHPPRASLLALTALSAGLAVSCGAGDTAPPATPPAASAPRGGAPASAERGVDVSAMDRATSPGSDFYAFANGAWVQRTEIPPDRSATSATFRLALEVERRTRALLEEAAHDAAATGDRKKAGDYYAAFMDEAGIEQRGTKPLAAELGRIAKLADRRELSAYLGSTLRADVDVLNDTHVHTDRFLGLWAEQDLGDPSRTVPYLLQGGLGMPDRSYYLDEAPKMADLRARYQAHLAKLLVLSGVAQAEADAQAGRIVALERRMAQVHGSLADTEDVKKGYNPWTAHDFAARAPGVDWAAFFAAAGLERQRDFVVWHPQAVVGMAALVQAEPLGTWKEYLTARTLDHYARFLPKAFAEEHFAFHEAALGGIPRMLERSARAVQRTNEALGEAVGKLYVERHFPASSKRDIQGLVDNIKAAFGRRIDGLSWMSAETKARAKAKLQALRVGIGYPDRFRDYAALQVDRADALGNVQRAELLAYEVALSQLRRPVDRDAWAMNPQTVNAVNLPVRNALNFPAAILEPPMYDAASTAAVKYAAAGAIIGHEISHSFDDQGALFDEKGKLSSWWTPADFAHFEASAAALAAQYDQYKPLPDASINGKQTLSENIADLAGLAAAYDAWRASLQGAPAPTVDGLTGEQQFFVSYAQSWQSKMREPALRQRLLADGHAPGPFRALTVRNLDPWYAAFDVKPGDALYLAPAARVRVW